MTASCRFSLQRGRLPGRLLRRRLLLECLESRNLLSAPGIVNVHTDTEGVVLAETTLAVNPTTGSICSDAPANRV